MEAKQGNQLEPEVQIDYDLKVRRGVDPLLIVMIGAIFLVVATGVYLLGQRLFSEGPPPWTDCACGDNQPDIAGSAAKYTALPPIEPVADLAVKDADAPAGWWSIEPDQESLL
ncbi:MAG: hypothetical protein IJM30_02565 [Thermoguttaceae bacterium]|nr:hypothetical protein [Thermoguttaceae bacterium]